MENVVDFRFIKLIMEVCRYFKFWENEVSLFFFEFGIFFFLNFFIDGIIYMGSIFKW